MWNCPICKRPSQGMQCCDCGFDGSLDYERYPSLGNLSHGVKTTACLRVLWKEKQDNMTICPVCGGWRFYLSKTKTFAICTECGKKLAIQQPMALTEPEKKQQADEKFTCSSKTLASLLKQPGIEYTVVGHGHSVTLHEDGTITATGNNEEQQCEVTSWKNIRDVAVGYAHTVGLQHDGTVVATGRSSSGRCVTTTWSDIQAIAAGQHHTVGLRVDGTAVATGADWQGACDVEGWHDLCAVAAGWDHTIGLQKDGTVVATGSVQGRYEIASWSDITAIAAGEYHSVGLCRDGSVVAAGLNASGQCDVERWRNVIAIAAGSRCTAGLCKDGSVLVAGNCSTEMMEALISQMSRKIS